jgi:uncharacterized SAM-binding protein YcdF (DUF218 family)
VSEPDDPAPARRGGVVSFPRRRWILPTLIVLISLGLLIGIGGDRLYLHPRVDPLGAGERLDAVVALGGRSESALYAQSLVQRGVAPVLVLSDPYPYPGQEGVPVQQACASHPTAYRLICFAPDPSTTRGEAREIETLAKANHWSRVAVVSPIFHVSRARLLVRRCYRTGTLLMLPAPMPVSLPAWTYQYVRQSLGFAKAVLMRGC